MVWRYWLLSGLFGAIFGVRFTLDVWMFQHLASASSGKFAFIGLTFAGMLIGELCAGPISDRVGRMIALRVAAVAIVGWAVSSILAVVSGNPSFLLSGTLLFGVGFGLFHSSLDAWFAEKASACLAVPALEFRLTQGYLTYNVGYLLGASLAFPLLLGFDWNLDLISSVLGGSFYVWPYVLALALVGAILLLIVKDGAAKPAVVADRPRITLRQIGRDYAAILTTGRAGLWGVLFVAGSIALIIQLIDHLAPAVLLPGATLAAKSLNVLVFNATVCVCVGTLQYFLHRVGGAEGIGPSVRDGIVKFSLCIVVLLLAFCSLETDAAAGWEGKWLGLVLGLAQAILLMLPPLMKAWVFEFNVGDRYATTLAVLGISKRLFAIVATFGLPWLVQLSGGPRPAGENVTLYGLATGVTLITLAILVFSARRPQRAV